MSQHALLARKVPSNDAVPDRPGCAAPNAALYRLADALQLEVHWEMLAARGCAAADFLAPLADIGYRGIRRRYRDYDASQRAGRSEPVSRMALEPS
jgi:hypothetical protein